MFFKTDDKSGNHYKLLIDCWFINSSCSRIDFFKVGNFNANPGVNYKNDRREKETRDDSGTLAITHLNIQGMMARKISLLEILIDECLPDVLCISEHWLNHGIQNLNVGIEF